MATLLLQTLSKRGEKVPFLYRIQRCDQSCQSWTACLAATLQNVVTTLHFYAGYGHVYSCRRTWKEICMVPITFAGKYDGFHWCSMCTFFAQTMCYEYTVHLTKKNPPRLIHTCHSSFFFFLECHENIDTRYSKQILSAAGIRDTSWVVFEPADGWIPVQHLGRQQFK